MEHQLFFMRKARIFFSYISNQFTLLLKTAWCILRLLDIFQSRAALSLLGYCLYQMQDFINAADCYEQLTVLHPEVEEYRFVGFSAQLHTPCVKGVELYPHLPILCIGVYKTIYRYIIVYMYYLLGCITPSRLTRHVCMKRQ